MNRTQTFAALLVLLLSFLLFAAMDPTPNNATGASPATNNNNITR